MHTSLVLARRSPDQDKNSLSPKFAQELQTQRDPNVDPEVVRTLLYCKDLPENSERHRQAQSRLFMDPHSKHLRFRECLGLRVCTARNLARLNV